jgi:hypothetical protein
MRQVRIESDGTPINTKITDADTGEPLKRVSSAVIWMDVKEIVRVDLTCIMPRVEVTAHVDSIVNQCPFCGHSETVQEGGVTCESSSGAVPSGSLAVG